MTSTRLRWAAVAATLLVALVAPACGGDDETAETGAEKSSEERRTTTTAEDSEDGSEGTIPDFGDELGDVGDCLEAAAAYASLALSALSSEDGAAEAQKQAEALKDQLPEELHDEIDVVAEAFGKVSSEGLIEGAEALDSPEFNKANGAIEEYFTETCGG